MTDTATQQPSPTKRGRGRGRGGAGRGAASARARGKPAAGRRGRAKIYETSRAQAAHERQRDLKNSYATLAAAMRPALEELADRNLDRLKSNFDAHKEVEQYSAINGFLNQRLADRISVLDQMKNMNEAFIRHERDAKNEYTNHSTQGLLDEWVDDYYDSLLHRLDILERLHGNGLPVDTVDDSWNFKSMTTEQAMNQGLYTRTYNDVEVPYPWLHPVLSQEANKSQALQTPSKRKATDQPDFQPTPKRPTSALDEKAGPSIPRHIGGLLSAVAPDEPVSQPPSPSPVDGNGDAATPPANEPAVGGRGRKRKPQAARSPSADGDSSEAEEDDMVPPVPNGAAEPDEHGVRLINKRARVNDMPNNRVMVPPLFEFEKHEIGFRDSTNDKSRGATKAKRRKFLNQPDSGAMFFDRNLCGYDATQYADGDLDQDTVEKHNLHPKYGLFLPTSTNDAEAPKPFENGQKPTVFVTDDGKVQHVSRSVAKAKNEQPYRKDRLRSAMLAFMDAEGLTEEDLRDEKTDRLLEEREAGRQAQRLALEQQEDEQDRQLFGAATVNLLAAAAEVESQGHQGNQAVPEAHSVSPALSRPSTMSRPYDAVRDVFGGTDLPPTVATPSAAIENTGATNLSLLADLALQEAPAPNGVFPAAAAVPDAPGMQQIPIQMPEPVRPKRLRDPSDLEQGESTLVTHDYPDPQHETQPRRLAMPEHFMGNEQAYAVQPAHPYYHDRTVPESPLARPESFNYREQAMTYEQLKQPMLPPQPFLGQLGSQVAHGHTESYGFGDAEMVSEPPQSRRPSQPTQTEDQYCPLVPNTQDVALLDPQLFEGGQRPSLSQLQDPQLEQKAHRSGSSVLQQPHTSFFQTALNSPHTPAPADPPHPSEYNESSHAYHQQPGQHMNGSSRLHLSNDGSPGRTPFSNPNGIEAQPLPPLRPLHRGSGPLMPPAMQGSQTPHHMMMSGELAEPYPPPPHAYTDQGYPPNGFGPDQPIMSTEQGLRAGSLAQPMMQSAQPPYHMQHPYPNPGPMGSQGPLQYENPPTGQALQSPPPLGSHGPGISPSPSRRSGSISSRSNNNKQYREIKPAPRQAETYDNNGSELRTLLYNPFEGIRDYHATAPPPSQGPTQIRGWTHSTGGARREEIGLFSPPRDIICARKCTYYERRNGERNYTPTRGPHHYVFNGPRIRAQTSIYQPFSLRAITATQEALH